MFERFTDRARKVMYLANQEAQRLNHEHIGTEHILLGLVKEGFGVAANVLKNLDIDLGKIRKEVESIVQPSQGLAITMGRMPHTPRAKQSLEFAIEEAKAIGHNYIGTEHLLLGLLREEQGIAAQVLLNLGVTLEAVREEVLNLVSPKVKEDTRGPELVAQFTAFVSLIVGPEVAERDRIIAELKAENERLQRDLATAIETTPPPTVLAALTAERDRLLAEVERLRSPSLSSADAMNRRVRVLYTNHRGETSWRTMVPMLLWFGSCEYHPGEQWLLDAVDVDKGVMRTFALLDMHKWELAP